MEEGYQKVLETIQKYPDQIKQTFDDFVNLDIPDDYENIENIVFCGMGGSALGARVVASLLIGELKHPMEIITDYSLPYYVNEKSLVILSSYSGGTEETLHCATQSIEKKAKVFGITTGGRLKDSLLENKIPFYLINPINNPSKQPRMALGYSISALLALFSKLKFVSIPDIEITNTLSDINNYLNIDVVNVTNQLLNKIPVIISAEHLKGISHAFKNQLNENSKTFSVIFDLPELNHHLMEGLSYPQVAKDNLIFIFLESDLYSDKIKRRLNLTKEIVNKNNIQISSYFCQGKTKLDQIFEILIVGSKISLELAKINKVDITSIPWVDYFKEQLAKS